MQTKWKKWANSTRSGFYETKTKHGSFFISPVEITRWDKFGQMIRKRMAYSLSHFHTTLGAREVGDYPSIKEAKKAVDVLYPTTSGE
mgnify:FL=1|tara:strand:+ start:6956 stop:7216 length:261 start_codon:yes stop_codon:yes gene_type:complete